MKRFSSITTKATNSHSCSSSSLSGLPNGRTNAATAAFVGSHRSMKKNLSQQQRVLHQNHFNRKDSQISPNSSSISTTATATQSGMLPFQASTMLFHTTTFPSASGATVATATTATTTGSASTATTLATSTTAVSVLDSLTSVLASPGGIATSVVGAISLLVYWKYNEAIRRRMKLIQEESWLFGAGVTMVRGETGGATNLFPNLQLLEVNPSFQKLHPEISIVGLGEYMTTLRPKQLPKGFSTKDLPKLIQKELEAGMASALLKALGPNLGRALLPAVGFGPFEGKAQSLASKMATRWIMSKERDIETLGESQDRAGLPISLLSILALSESNAKLNSGSSSSTAGVAPSKNEKQTKMDSDEDTSTSASIDDDDDKSSLASLNDKLPGTDLSAMDKMIQGENVNGPTFDTDMVPTQGFVLFRDFHTTIRQMESRMLDQGHCADHTSTELQTAQAEIQEQELKEGKKQKLDCEDPNAPSYDPNDRSMGDPVPINPRLFPDLHLGYGDAPCTHTKRQVLQMRLISVLLNRLGSNYHRLANGEREDVLFKVQLTEDGPTIAKPHELIQCLIDMGQDVTVVPTSRITSFGIGMCLKESDGSWSNIPLGVFLESGYEDEEGNMAPVMMPHSGVRIILGDGPLTNNQETAYDDFDGSTITNPLIIQHFIGIEGFCGWKSDQNPEVPFNENVESGRRLTNPEEIVRAVRLSGLYATALNGLATDLELPFGGYGVTAVCNDSAAVIQQCLYGESYIFPLTSIGRYMQRTLRYTQSLHSKLRKSSSSDSMEEELKDIIALEDAMKELPSDINASPSNAYDAARRLINTLQTERPLTLMNDSKTIMERIQKEHEKQGISQSTRKEEVLV